MLEYCTRAILVSLLLSAPYSLAHDGVDKKNKVRVSPSDFNLLLEKADAKQKCQLKVIKQLGWDFVEGSGTKYSEGTEACRFSNADDARTAGFLRIEFEKNKVEPFLNKLDEIISSPASMCGYKYRIANATLAAIAKLEKNKKFRFGSKNGKSEAPEKYWTHPEFPDMGDLVAHDATPSQAVECFYNDSCRTDCCGGANVTELAMLRELYGPLDFDRAFNVKELGISGDRCDKPPVKKANAASPFFGRTASDKIVLDLEGKELSKMGAAALIGFIGYFIVDTRSMDDIKSPNDIGETYIITRFSQEAAEQLLKNGGFPYYTKQNRRVWELELRKRAGKISDGELKEYNELLSSPMYKGVSVFIHPTGQETMGKLITRLVGVNPKIPYKDTGLYADDLNTGLFKRYTDYYLNKCLDANK